MCGYKAVLPASPVLGAGDSGSYGAALFHRQSRERALNYLDPSMWVALGAVGEGPVMGIVHVSIAALLLVTSDRETGCGERGRSVCMWLWAFRERNQPPPHLAP